MSTLGRLKGLLVQEEVRWGTRYYLRHARVGRRPIVVGRPLVENRHLDIGDDLLLWSKGGRTTFLLGSGNIVLGNRVFINSGATIDAAACVRIGDDVAISYDAYISDTSSHGLEGRRPSASPVSVGVGTWVGLRAIILPGVTIGRRCVIAANAVVAKDVPDDTLVAGVPATPIRRLEYPPGTVRAWTD